MMEETDFIAELVAEIMTQGIDRETAVRYAVRIGDRPILDPAGNVLVLDKDLNVMAKLKPLRFFSAV